MRNTASLFSAQSRRHAAYTAGARAAMPSADPYVVPDDHKDFAEDWKLGYRETQAAFRNSFPVAA